jgi:hypothetical protein
MDLFLDVPVPPHPPALFSGWVYVSSLAMRTYRKSPLLRRWCEVKEDGILNFFRDKTDVEPTKRIHLKSARVVVSRGPRLTTDQLEKIGSDSPKTSAPLMAFYIDFPSSSSRRTPIVETRFYSAAVRMMSMGSMDSPRNSGKGSSENPSPSGFPLGFVMVCSHAGEEWAKLLLSFSAVPVPRDRKLARAKRWVSRAWMKLTGHLSDAQFDEEVESDSDEVAANFFSVNKPPSDDQSFQSVSEGDEDDVEDQVLRRESRKHDRASSSVHGVFESVDEMFACPEDAVRHATPISQSELKDVLRYVEATKSYSLGDVPSTWSICSEGDGFDCFKSVDETSGVLRTRTWAKIHGVVPHTLFHILHDPEARKNWDYHYVVFERVPESMWAGVGEPHPDPSLDVIDAVVAAPLGCANRQFLEWRRCMKNKSGKFMIYLRSWEPRNGGPAVPKKTVRADVWLSGYIIDWWRDETTGEILGSQVMVMTQIDIKGLIPKYIVNALASSAPRKWVKGVTTAALADMANRRDDMIGMTSEALFDMYGMHPDVEE